MTFLPRIECEHARDHRCGGCPMIAHDYSVQLERKRARVAQAFSEYPLLSATEIAPVEANPDNVEYRTRAKLVVDESGNVGLFAVGSHDVVDIPSCYVMDPLVREVVALIRGRVRTQASGVFASSRLRGLDVRRAGATILVTLIYDNELPARESLSAAGEELISQQPAIAGVAASVRRATSPQLLGKGHLLVAGQSRVKEDHAGVFSYATFGSFAQASRAMASKMREAMMAELKASDGRRVLELYSGSGTHALMLARKGFDLTMVESFEPAVDDARAAAEEQGLNLRAYARTAAVALTERIDAHEKFDAVVVNPPRRGLEPEVRRAMVQLGPSLIVYMSCDPSTLARDASDFARMGYRPSKIRPFDMIPQTNEVECLVRFDPMPSLPFPKVLYEDESILIVDKLPHEPTTPQGEHQHSLLARARMRFPNATPAHRLDIDTSGACILAKTPATVDAWSKALAAANAQKQYLALVPALARKKGVIAKPIREEGRNREAVTRYETVERVGTYTLLRVMPEHGRKHQIRKHFAAIGHPLVGDVRYGKRPTNQYFHAKHGLDRVFLHCARLELTHPRSGAELVVESPLAGDLAHCLASMG